ncbi:MAG: hypothetical protein MRZ37_03525 [Tenericutes bacterium]|nr:hypothetical protein [Mycoplasmatota bacterium]
MTIKNDNIYLTQSELDSLPYFATEQNHTESNLYLNKNLVFKIFKNKNDIALMKNKEKKIDFLKTSNIEEFILPKHKIYVDNFFAGYSSNHFTDSKTLDNIYYLPLDKKIQILTKVSQSLENIHENCIILGDINAGNILYNNNTIKFADIDSANIEDLPCDNYSQALNNQNIDPFRINTVESDIYLLNLLVLELVLYYDVANMPAYDKETFISDINTYRLPIEINNIFTHLYDMVNGEEYYGYPHEYLDSLGKHLIKRNRKN